ncbi:MAG: endonuclease domain-containing protein [Bacteroidota bacterium]
MSAPESLLEFHLTASKTGGWVREFVFAPPRKYRLDFAFIEEKLGVEVDGAIWVKGRHGTGTGITNDCEKMSLAAIHGWRIIRVTPEQVKQGKALEWIRRALNKEV